MDTIPKKSIAARPYRFFLDLMEPYLVFPFKNPDVYSALSVLFSIPFLFVHGTTNRLALLIIVLFLDWMDGAAARKFKGKSKKGYVVDVMFDRLGDGIITASVVGSLMGNMLFSLYLVNNLLTLYAMKSGKHYLLAVRAFYGGILILQLIYPNQPVLF
jgi:phosphatidylglycerophosphate synthase